LLRQNNAKKLKDGCKSIKAGLKGTIIPPVNKKATGLW
jgi:hypothetical protein